MENPVESPPDGQRASSSKLVCIEFIQGQCRRQPCRFVHPIGVTMENIFVGSRLRCLEFQKGGCIKGLSCRYAHKISTPVNQNSLFESNKGFLLLHHHTISSISTSSFPRKSSMCCVAFQKSACERGHSCRFSHVDISEATQHHQADIAISSDSANHPHSVDLKGRTDVKDENLALRLLSSSFIESVVPGALNGLFSQINGSSLTLKSSLQRLRTAEERGTLDTHVVDALFDCADLCLRISERAAFDGLLPEGLSIDELAAIKMYTAPEHPPENGLYYQVNSVLRESNRTRVWPFAEIILFLIMALEKLPPISNCVVFRGIRRDLTSVYKIGCPAITWPSFTSTTRKLGVLNDPLFLGTTGPRTMCMITLTQSRARSLTDISMVAGEDEIILPPNSSFKVESVLLSDDGLLHVQLTELEFRMY